ncbi:SDR family NAD(P)-dependent oxidoreductase [Rothia nasimurium]|uniref:SDR family NAD(P)-dependent oxidoreductase n=1 Tax=Rothia nasimurium TaxID=85336 RepID=A0A4Y9F3Z0_9MICC|nr:SDR family NAD(P)-dependent oxidoreductase [Rothia nasimurium]MBF0808409.1 SDR family NAD(P)-dependent oxidoreductase [Rothia nasimurium]TFU22114.1 SDR family NAD(P)-dependent oxidoreductase [Rothia nasimurium]
MTRPKAIIITGAAGGIGTALRDLLLQMPDFSRYSIIASDTPDNLNQDQSPAKNWPSRVIPAPLNLTDHEALKTFVASVAQDYDITGLAHLAGVLAHGPVIDLNLQEFDSLLAVNVTAMVHLYQAVAQAMVAQAQGPEQVDRAIVTVASNAANGPRAHMAAYGASKAFASHFTRSLGLELAPWRVRTNVVNPGTTLTPMVHAMWGGEDQRTESIAGDPKLYRAGIPLGRVAEPADIAHPVAFLLSPAARHINLAELTVDGGATQR